MARIKLQDYANIIRPQDMDEIILLAEKVRRKSVKMVNSTAIGGGVAEILHRLVPLFEELGIQAKWQVIKGTGEFFTVTKAFHNALHGAKVEVSPHMFEVYEEINEMNARELDFEEDIIEIHDPQPAALIKVRGRSKGKWLWRCHIDTSHPDPQVWNYLKNYIIKYDASIFSSPSFAKELPLPQYLVNPAIDPLAEKNRELSRGEIDSVLKKFKIPKDKPIITQVSRFDYLKDPLGVIDAYRLVKKQVDCRLILAGGTASDDPESTEVLNKIKEHARNDPDIHILILPPFSDFEVNALQRASAVVLQKSLREGFGLTVTEALWKGKPVVASAVGGIPNQIVHNFTGVLVHSVEGAAYQIRYLLTHPEAAEKLGRYGKEYVREKFLLTRMLRNYLLLFIALDHPGKSIIEF